MALGGERYTAFLLRRGFSPESALAALEKKYKFSTVPDRKRTLDIAQQGMDSGEYLSELDRNSQVDYGKIVENPNLFGGDSGKGRFFISATYGIPGANADRDYNIILPSELTIDMLFQSIELSLDQWQLQYPSKFEAYVNREPGQVQVSPWFAERMF